MTRKSNTSGKKLSESSLSISRRQLFHQYYALVSEYLPKGWLMSVGAKLSYLTRSRTAKTKSYRGLPGTLCLIHEDRLILDRNEYHVFRIAQMGDYDFIFIFASTPK